MFDRDPLMSLTVFDLTVLKERKRFELKCFSNLQLFQIVSYISFKGINIYTVRMHYLTNNSVSVIS